MSRAALEKRLEVLEKHIGPPQQTFQDTPESFAFSLIAESDRRLILDLFESRPDGYEPEAAVLQRATPEQAAAYARYEKFVHIVKEIDRAAEQFQKLADGVDRNAFDPDVRKAARAFQDLVRVKQHYMDREEPPGYLVNRLAAQGYDGGE